MLSPSLAEQALAFEVCTYIFRIGGGMCGARIYPASSMEAHLIWHAKRDEEEKRVLVCRVGQHEWLAPHSLPGRSICPKHARHRLPSKRRKYMSSTGVEKRDLVKHKPGAWSR